MVDKISSLVDKFAYASLDPNKWDSPDGAVIANNRLKLEPGQGITSKNQYDFTNSQAFVQISPDGTVKNFMFQFATLTDSIGITLQDSSALMFWMSHNDEVDSYSIDYNINTHKFWRMTEKQGMILWETSPDGLNWTVQMQRVRSFPLDVGILSLYNNTPIFVQPLPEKVVGGYFAKYKSKDDLGVERDMLFQEIDPRYGLVYLFQAGPLDEDAATYPRGTGAVNLTTEGGGQYFTQAEWKTGVQYLRGRGTTVLLTMGGGGAYVDLSTREKTNTFIKSVKAIYKQVGGFDGLDFNLETSFAYIRGGTPAGPAISVSGDQLTITDSNLLNRTTYNGDPNLLETNELASTPEFTYPLKITIGAGAGQFRTVVSNTSDTITVDTPFDPPIDSTSLYEIGLPIFPGEVVYAAQQMREIYGSEFAISIPAAGSFVGPFIQHDLDLVDALNNNVDSTGKKLLDFLAPQFYDLWYDQPDTTNAARASYIVATINQWATHVDGDWSRLGMGFLTNGPQGSAVSPEAARIAYLLTQVDHPTIRGAFHFDIQGDRRTIVNATGASRDEWEWINDLYPIINATEIGGTPAPPLSGTPTTFSDATGWTLSGGATISGGNLVLPFGSYGDIRQASLNGVYSLVDGYIQIELTSRPTASEAWLDFGWEGSSSAEYSFLRLYTAGSAAGFELHTKTTAGTEKTAYYPYPVPSGTMFLRIRRLFDYMFLSVSTPSDNHLRTIGFEDLAFTPGYTTQHVFIRANGQGTAGAWTIASFNQGGPVS